MNYVQALWRGVESVGFEGATEVESSHPYFGRLVHYERFDSAGHWEAIQSHPQTGARFTIVMPGDGDVPIQPYANFYRRAVGSADAILRRCAADLAAAFDSHAATLPGEPARADFALEMLTLPAGGREDGIWSACFHAPAVDTHFEVHFEGAAIRKVCCLE
jgi:hypothetical protein